MNVDRHEVRTVVDVLAGAATMLAPALSAWPLAAYLTRLVATALGVTTMMLRDGATPDEAIAAIRRVRRIDTTADDARADAAIAAKPARAAATLEPPILPLPWHEPADEAD